MMTKSLRTFVAVVLSFACALTMLLSANALTPSRTQTLVSQTTEQLSEDAYIVISIYDTSTARSSKTGYKTYDYVYAGKVAWSLSVYGTFEKSWFSYKCIADSVTYSTAANWSCITASSWHDDDSATASGTFDCSSGFTESAEVSLYCDSSGNFY